MIVADLPKAKREIYYMVNKYADERGITFENAVKEITAIAKTLPEKPQAFVEKGDGSVPPRPFVRIKGKTE